MSDHTLEVGSALPSDITTNMEPATESNKSSANENIEEIEKSSSDPKISTSDMVMAARSFFSEKSVNLEEFEFFPRLPAEIRVKIIGEAAKFPRYIPLSHDYSCSPDGKWRATYMPAKNYASVMQIHQESRLECLEKLQVFDHFENHIPSPRVPGQAVPDYVHINWESDIMVLDFPGAWKGWTSRFTARIPAREKANLQRLAVMIPIKGYQGIRYMDAIREALPNLRELCLFPERSGPMANPRVCEYPSVSGNPTVLVDVSASEEDPDYNFFHFTFAQIEQQFAKVKAAHPDWKLEKVRRVVWAKENAGEGSKNVGRVADIHGSGIFEQTKDEESHDEEGAITHRGEIAMSLMQMTGGEDFRIGHSPK